ncbi:glycosyltransferase [Desertihabitans aurantiacus]|uniref:glycosyltransferase n=1 Tax=Desertihabitans aurantiacus TaxID=2282477 RepID=UPI000DF7CC0C|nr:glycosyltransferase [Desertihabitans aurantiacus]
MSTFLICCTPAHGHVLPLVAVARHLDASGHRVLVLTSERYRARVEAAGARLVPLPADADIDLDRAADLPGRAGLRGPAALRFDLRQLFLRPAPAQLAALEAVLASEPVDAVLTEPLFVGAAMLTARPRATRPPVVALGIFPLGAMSRDAAPFGLGLTPVPGPLGRVRNVVLNVVASRVVFGSVQREAEALFRSTAGAPLRRFLMDWTSTADALVQFTVPGFEYPRSDLPATVHFVGPLPPAVSEVAVPAWWPELQSGRPVVHVTQGTIANSDPEQLILPTVRGLADRDALVVVSTGGRPVAMLGDDLPGNVRVAEYLPYDRLLPLVDVMVTNGGYGGVQQALAHGVPLVVAGQTEDKLEVTARVGWSGAGINLRTDRAADADVAAAVDTVLSDPSYRTAAARIGAEIAGAPGLAGLDAVLAGLGGSVAVSS